MAGEQFRKDLQRMDTKLRNKTIKAAMKAALKPVAEQIKSDAPVETGELESSIKVKPGKRKKDHLVMSVIISTPDDNPHVWRTEAGSREQAPKPFIRPAVKDHQQQMLDTFVEKISEALD